MDVLLNAMIHVGGTPPAPDHHHHHHHHSSKETQLGPYCDSISGGGKETSDDAATASTAPMDSSFSTASSESWSPFPRSPLPLPESDQEYHQQQQQQQHLGTAAGHTMKHPWQSSHSSLSTLGSTTAAAAAYEYEYECDTMRMEPASPTHLHATSAHQPQQQTQTQEQTRRLCKYQAGIHVARTELARARCSLTSLVEDLETCRTAHHDTEQTLCKTQASNELLREQLDICLMGRYRRSAAAPVPLSVPVPVSLSVPLLSVPETEMEDDDGDASEDGIHDDDDDAATLPLSPPPYRRAQHILHQLEDERVKRRLAERATWRIAKSTEHWKAQVTQLRHEQDRWQLKRAEFQHLQVEAQAQAQAATAVAIADHAKEMAAVEVINRDAAQRRQQQQDQCVLQEQLEMRWQQQQQQQHSQETLQRERDEYEQQLQIERERYTTLQASHQMMFRQLGDLKAVNARQVVRNESIQAIVEESQVAISKLQAENTLLRAEQEQKQQATNELSQALQERNQRLQKELVRSRTRNDQLCQELQRLQRGRQSARESVKDLHSTMTVMESTRRDLEHDRQGLTSELSGLQYAMDRILLHT